MLKQWQGKMSHLWFFGREKEVQLSLKVLHFGDQHQRISLGKAAVLAGVAVEEFMSFSAQREFPPPYTMADWEIDQATARELRL
jgi:predicted HTH domain antitoxin